MQQQLEQVARAVAEAVVRMTAEVSASSLAAVVVVLLVASGYLEIKRRCGALPAAADRAAAPPQDDDTMSMMTREEAAAQEDSNCSASALAQCNSICCSLSASTFRSGGSRNDDDNHSDVSTGRDPILWAVSPHTQRCAKFEPQLSPPSQSHLAVTNSSSQRLLESGSSLISPLAFAPITTHVDVIDVGTHTGNSFTLMLCWTRQSYMNTKRLELEATMS
uniref:Uncharacterized protein n=1 Tax=Oryza rufipogon TaxID=4529 RepID=A0A0E0PGB1_ORYRU